MVIGVGFKINRSQCHNSAKFMSSERVEREMTVILSLGEPDRHRLSMDHAHLPQFDPAIHEDAEITNQPAGFGPLSGSSELPKTTWPNPRSFSACREIPLVSSSEVFYSVGWWQRRDRQRVIIRGLVLLRINFLLNRLILLHLLLHFPDSFYFL